MFSNRQSGDGPSLRFPINMMIMMMFMIMMIMMIMVIMMIMIHDDVYDNDDHAHGGGPFLRFLLTIIIILKV